MSQKKRLSSLRRLAKVTRSKKRDKVRRKASRLGRISPSVGIGRRLRLRIAMARKENRQPIPVQRSAKPATARPQGKVRSPIIRRVFRSLAGVFSRGDR